MKNKNTVIITYEGGNSELFWKKSAGVTDERIEVLVPETHYAVAIKDGKYLDTFSGGKFLVSEKSRKNLTSTDIIFMSKTHKLRILWGTKNPFVFVSMPMHEGFTVGASGEYEVQISSPKHFYLELVGTDDVYDVNNLKDRLQSKILATIENEIRTMIDLYKWNAKTLPSYKQKISEFMQIKLSRMLELEYGLKLSSFLITNIIANINSSIETNIKEKREESGSTFCSHCGVMLAREDNYCFNCGKKIANFDKSEDMYLSQRNYCSKCGKPVDGGQI